MSKCLFQGLNTDVTQISGGGLSKVFCVNYVLITLVSGYSRLFSHSLVRCRHRALIGACVLALSERMDDVASSTEWETEWLSLDREQLVEFIRSSELTVKDEWDLWQV